MSAVVFPFEKVPSKIFRTIYRPIAIAEFWSYRLHEWQEVIGIIDTGADYTLLPKFYADDFGVNLKKDCLPKLTKGVGGDELVFLCSRMKVRFLGQVFKIPVAFLNRDDIPPLYGRHKFLNKFKLTFYRYQARFE
jgi:hypothetical protein